ncbi:TonB-dependent receptor plug domain-containing protein [Roseateles violae]|uniref:TonB-dependent receptor n=1 Tax=Roseateles violae TaxID=3058042 RepID=A0ABT8DPA8_9BURK|nr:TonB-dependent receptor [Pelomonas sp. PFR6]MDN3918885.1 TonB-dependent receptor [Pelomonas sp. PFR6]
MFKRNAISAAALVTISAFAAVPAFAQDAQEKLERVEVTGSRLKTVGNTSSSPISSVGKDDIAISQPIAVEELIRGLPSAYPAIGPAMNNGSNGTASIDLRGLGSNRTLVLINGKRFVPATLGGVVDTNTVPVSLLERVDLLTGGASVVYGADAVSGVVNFVTKKNFSGIEASTLYSISEQGDAARYNANVTMGANLADGRGNVALNVGSTRTDPLKVGQRDYAATIISSSTGAPGGFSGTAVPGQFSGMPAPINGSKVIDATTGLFRTAVNPADFYNTNPPNYFETPLDRTQVSALGHFRINDNAEAFAEVFHTRSNVTLNLAPSGTFGVGLDVPVGNPFIPQTVRSQLCSAYLAAELAKPAGQQSAAKIAGLQPGACVAGNPTEVRMNISRRFTEAGPRVYTYDNNTTQYTVGLRGDLPVLDGWNYETYYQSGKSNQLQQTQNGFSNSKLQQAVRATNTTSCTVTTGGCVPVNLFGGAGTITPEMLAFLSIPTFATTEVRQDIISASASGEVAVAKSPWAKAPLNLSVGYENREVFGGNKSDAVIQTQGELLGSGAPTPDRNGTLKFDELYTEAKLPLIQGVTGIQSLELGGGYRYTNFRTSGGAKQDYDSWKGGLEWTPFKGLRFRGEQQRATRAPNVNELYQPVTTGLATLSNDLCAGGAISNTDPTKAGLTNLCKLTGVPNSQVGVVAQPSSNQVNNTAGGNPNLGPEKADTTTLGLVWEPSFVDNLSLTLDYWKIKVNGAVSSPTVGQVMSGCYDPTLNPGYAYNVFCGMIQRDPGNGGLNGVGSKGIVTQSSNLGTYNFDGIDVGAYYRLPLKNVGAPNWGRLDFNLQYSYLGKADYQSLPGVATLHWAGHYGVDVGTPYMKNRFSQRTTWNINDFTFGYNWRYVGESTVQDPLPASTDYVAAFKKLPAVNYFDLNGVYRLSKNFSVSMTINNLFDKQPPLIGTGIGTGATNFGNTMPGVYDVIGRRYTVNATATF